MEEIRKALGFEGKTRRLRSFGHILNLAVKALLFSHNSEAFEDDIQGNKTLDAKAHGLWRWKGPVRKLYNLIFWIHRLDSLTNLLRSLQLTAYSKSDDPVVRAKKPLDVIIDVVTCWLSTLYMIRHALLLKGFLEDLWDENKLEEKDWAIISLFNEVLQHFEHVFITLEGDGQQRKRKEGYIGADGCLWDTLLG
ncbi:AC9 transposase [Fusarium beomiforme]|uniref:AC9 transposase n=1 Tax=Fusarium beomiforme TaxID=44412 RepID=A0A9P5A9N1_9HYPO|nr:AC9 transposase [Fusarium beomiforme]